MDNQLLHTILENAVLVFEGIAALLAFICYKKYSHTYLRFFPWLLLYVFLTEIAAIFVLEHFKSNVVIYNVYNIILFLYFYFVFYKNTASKRDKKLILAAVSIFLVSSIVNLIFSSFYATPQLLAYITGACMLILCIILYFVEILYTSQKIQIDHDLLFWVSIGLLLFYVGYIPIKLSRHFFESARSAFMTLLVVHRILVLIMNGCFIIGFLWTRQK